MLNVKSQRNIVRYSPVRNSSSLFFKLQMNIQSSDLFRTLSALVLQAGRNAN